VFAIASWFIFGALLAGRYFYGWRGRTALRWTLAGFVALLLAYVGSRFVARGDLAAGRRLAPCKTFPSSGCSQPSPSCSSSRRSSPMAETGMMAINRYRLRALERTGRRGARLAADLLRDTDKLLSVLLAGNTLINAAITMLVSVITIDLFGQERAVLGSRPSWSLS